MWHHPRVRPSGVVLAIVATGCAARGVAIAPRPVEARSATPATLPSVASPAVASPAVAASVPPPAAAPSVAAVDVTGAIAIPAPLRRDPRLDAIAAAAATSASGGYLVSTPGLRAATAASLGSDVLPYLLTGRGDDDAVVAQLSVALAELHGAVALEAVGVAAATGATGRVVALVATPVPTGTVAVARRGDEVSVTLAWPWPPTPAAFLVTANRNRRVLAKAQAGEAVVIVRCDGPRPVGFRVDASLEIDAGKRLVASVPAVCGGRSPPSPDFEIGPPARTVVEIEQRLFELMNQERAAQGVPVLAWDVDAHRMARAHAADMARRAFVGHRGSDGATLADRVRVHRLPAAETFENVGRASGPGEAHAGFLASPGHRANLLAAVATRGAVGVVGDRSGDLFYVAEVLFEPAR